MKDFHLGGLPPYFVPMIMKATRNRTDEQPDNHLAMIGEGVELRGILETDEDLRICGILAGSIRSKSKVVLSPTASVLGDILCGEAEIHGRVKGNLDIKGLLRLRGNAVVEGDITANRIQVDEGVFLLGRCRMRAIPGGNAKHPHATD